MKTSYSILIGCISLSVALVLSSIIISNKMYSPAHFPNSLSVTTFDGEKKLSESNDFISSFEAASYLRMEESKLKDLIKSGELIGTYTSYKNSGEEIYIFSSSKLTEWMKNKIQMVNKLD